MRGLSGSWLTIRQRLQNYLKTYVEKEQLRDWSLVESRQGHIVSITILREKVDTLVAENCYWLHGPVVFTKLSFGPALITPLEVVTHPCWTYRKLRLARRHVVWLFRQGLMSCHGPLIAQIRSNSATILNGKGPKTEWMTVQPVAESMLSRQMPNYRSAWSPSEFDDAGIERKEYSSVGTVPYSSFALPYNRRDCLVLPKSSFFIFMK